MDDVAATEHRTGIQSARTPQGRWEHRIVCVCGWKSPRTQNLAEAQKSGLIHQRTASVCPRCKGSGLDPISDSGDGCMLCDTSTVISSGRR